MPNAKDYTGRFIKLHTPRNNFAITSLNNATATIEYSLLLMEATAKMALNGDENAIAFLNQIGLEAAEKSGRTILVHKRDSAIADWIKDWMDS
jgi:hypothetical protein